MKHKKLRKKIKSACKKTTFKFGVCIFRLSRFFCVCCFLDAAVPLRSTNENLKIHNLNTGNSSLSTNIELVLFNILKKIKHLELNVVLND